MSVNMCISLLALIIVCYLENGVYCLLFGDITWNMALNGESFLKTFTGVGLLKCVEECQFSGSCCSLNYNRNFLLCELNSGNNLSRTLLQKNGYVYSDIETWGRVGVHKTCPYKGCGEPPTIQNGRVRQGLSSVGSIRTYDCDAGYLTDHPSVTCLPDGNWSTPTPICRDIASCLDIKSCDIQHVDGEYQIRPTFMKGQTVKLYCHGLNTSSPTEFITLHKPNVASYSVGKLGAPCEWYNATNLQIDVYRKVKINLKDMSIVTRDETFVDTFYGVNGGLPDSQSRLVEYGFGGECSSEFSLRFSCTPQRPVFIVDLTYTGFAIDSKTNWKVYGYKAGIYSLVRSEDSRSVQGICGGYCGYCRTEHNKIWLKPDLQGGNYT